ASMPAAAKESPDLPLRSQGEAARRVTLTGTPCFTPGAAGPGNLTAMTWALGRSWPPPSAKATSSIDHKAWPSASAFGALVVKSTTGSGGVDTVKVQALGSMGILSARGMSSLLVGVEQEPDLGVHARSGSRSG